MAREPQEQAGRLIEARLDKPQGLPFPHFYADFIMTQAGPHDTVQMTFYYLPIVGELSEPEATDPSPGGAAPHAEASTLPRRSRCPSRYSSGGLTRWPRAAGSIPPPDNGGQEDA